MAEIRPQVAAAIDCYTEQLKERGIDVERVFLYGSQLSDKQHAYSDVDVVAVADDFRDRTAWELAEVVSVAEREAFRRYGESIETLTKTPDEIATCHPSSFLAEVLKDAVVVYERDGVGTAL